VDESNFNTLLDGLSSFEFPSESKNLSKAHPSLKDEDVNQYVLDKSKALIEAGVTAVQDMTPYVVQGQNPDEVAALAELMSATTKALETLNKTNLIDRKAKKDEQLKKLDIQGKKELAQLQPGNKTTNNMNVLVASREEIFKKLFDQEAEVLEIQNK
jgi:predicted amidohydrolase YtcJ